MDLKRLAKSAPSGMRKDKPDQENTRNCSRGIRRAFASSSNSSLPAAIKIDIPIWDDASRSCKDQPVSFILPHLVVDHAVTAFGEGPVCAISPDRPDLRDDLAGWSRRTKIPIDAASGPIAGCSLWGDGAPYDRNGTV